MSGGLDDGAGNVGAPNEQGGSDSQGLAARNAGSEPLPEWTVTIGPDTARQVGSQPTATPEAPEQRPIISEPRPAKPQQQTNQPQPALLVDERSEQPGKRGIGAMGLVGLGVLGALLMLGVGAAGYAIFGSSDDGSGDAALSSEASDGSSGTTVEDIQRLLQGIGYQDVTVEEQDGTIFLSGAVETQADNAAVVTASASLAGGLPINTDGLLINPDDLTVGSTTQPTTDPGPQTVTGADPLQRLQTSLNRTMAATPVIFEPGTSSIASWHVDTLDTVAATLLANPGIAVTVVGYTDGSGTASQNQELSEARTSAVRDYLIAKGLEPGLIQTDARGESEASGLRDVGYLERRVEFQVVAVSLTPPVPLPLNVGVIVPSARDDLAFSQSLVDALDVLNDERGGLTLAVTENMFDVDAAKAQAEEYANSGSDVVILHGAQFRPFVEELAIASPEVVFVAGPDPLASELPNVFVYTVAAEQGAYVLGDLAASLSDSGTIGVVGPVPAAEPKRFVEGFRLGAEQRGATVLSEYTGSFSDVEAAAAASAGQVSAGADVLTGTSQMTVGPIELAANEGLLWFANQANQTSLAPDNVVASQVYHFEVAIREILAEIDANSTTGGIFPLTLGNGGMLLEFNPNYPLDDDLRTRADDLLFEVTAGSVSVEVDLEE